MTSSSALLSILVLGALAQLTQAQLGGGNAGAIVDAHNRLRRAYGINQMVSWSGGLAGYAQGRANAQAARCGLSHSGLRGGTGENLAMGSGGGDLNTIMRLVGLWVAEGPTGGHWKQMAWAQTSQVGCAIAYGCGSTYLACNYNVQVMTGQNVWTGNPSAPRPPPPPPAEPTRPPPPPPAPTTPPPAPEATPSATPSATPTESSASAAPSETASPAPANPDAPKPIFDFSSMFPPALPGDSTAAFPEIGASANAGSGSNSGNTSGGRIAGGSNTDENGRVTLSSDLQSSASSVSLGALPAVAAVVVAGAALFA